MPHLQFNSRVVDGLYAEALVLMNEARHAFAPYIAADAVALPDATLQMLVTSEKEKALERMTQALTWLRDQQGHFVGQQSTFRLRLRRLPRAPAALSSQDLALLPRPLAELAEAITHFYERLQQIENDWRPRQNIVTGALSRLRARKSG